MNDKDNPFGVGGGGERTVFRPNPGGRLPPAQPSPPPNAPPRAPAGYPQPAAPRPVAPSAQPFAGIARPAAASAPSQGRSDEWIATPKPAQPMAADGVQRAEDLRFEDLAAQHENPIMRAAGPLLLLLGRLRVAMVSASLASLMEQVAAAVGFFEKEIYAAGVPADQAKAAKYIVCATADDIVQNIPTDDRHIWTQYSMLSRFFGERIGGVRFFEELDRLKAEPAVNYNVLELQHACLALGFQGLHRTSGGGAMQLQTIQRNLYETLRRIRPKIAADLSPRWKGLDMAVKGNRLRLPVWVVAGVAALGLFAVFATLRSMLGQASERTAEANIALHPLTKITLQRRLPGPPPPPPAVTTQLQRIRSGLDPGIPGCVMTADYAGKWIAMRICSGIMFDSGKADILPQFKPVAEKIAKIVEGEKGPVTVIGHTDNQPLNKTNRFKNNLDLSIARSQAATALMQPLVSDKQRLQTEGHGSDDPVADNKTPEGRARNRRVEFLITRTD